MSKYFSLFEECLLVPEENNPAVYNTFSGKIYKITQEEATFLSYLELSEKIERAADLTGISVDKAFQYIDLYTENRIGCCSEKAKNTSKNFPNFLSLESYWLRPSPRIQLAIISLSKLCAGNCVYCNQDEVTTAYTCSSCTGIEKRFNNSFLPINTAEKILTDLHLSGCENILFRIPDYTVNKNYFDKIFDITSRKSFTFSAVLIGYGNIIDDDLKNIQRYNITPVLQFNVTSDKDLERTIKLMNHYNTISSSHRYHVLVDIDYGRTHLKELLALRKEKVPYIISFDAIIPKNSEAVTKLDIDLFNRALTIPRTTPFHIAHNYGYNECLDGKIYFNQDGNVYPCPALTDFYIGNGMNMRAIFNEDNLMNFWMLAKKKISPCSDCGLKYACTDCRGLDYKIGGKLEVNLFCPFGEERNVQ